MIISGNVSFNGVQQKPFVREPGNTTTTNDSAPEIRTNNLPASAWQANRLPFTSLKISAEDFKDKMHNKIDKIKDGSYVKAVRDKAVLLEEKGRAVLNIQGPLEVQCEGVEKQDAAALKEKFQNIASVDDLKTALQDPRIPDNVPVVITEPASQNFKVFMGEVERGNATNNKDMATAIVKKALEGMGEDQVVMPDISIEASRKELVLSLIDHLKAGMDYEPLSLVYSPFFSFKSGDELKVDLPLPVYER
jgi:hypothetical protein